MKVAIFTLGCRVNIYDTEIMISALKKNGFQVVSSDEFADVYCINTCTVTNNSDKKSRQFISRCKKSNPEAIIVMVGCYPQVSKEEVSNIQDVDIILGNRFKNQLPYYINLFVEKREKVVKIDENILKNVSFEDGSLENLQERHRAFIKIQDGCNKFCTYCIIPFARGGVCSKEPRKVFDEVKSLVSNGYREVILTGINTTSYGDDLGIEINLVDLIEMLDPIKGLERIRLGSVDPEFFDIEIIRRLKNVKKLMPHFHLSLQSGCDETLKRMRRKYDTAKYEEVVNQLRELIDDVSITTDIIVGFPGETENEFLETVEFLKKIKLQDMHVFKYSKRTGTKAALMDFQIDGSVKDERSKIILSINALNKVDFMKKYLGKVVDVLYCTVASDEKGMYGYTNNYIKVYLDSTNKEYLGQIVPTLIKNFNEEFLIGQAVV
ncbi:MAG TPA: tRNA (N(6)-L-threonylcarbamoyladenosine(37)-C(2))-methylthiotransferase MtaB [Candidatus Dwaynia gallinarum]|nr:tRNA (N(6)-L-threonylcarbamoyladenosine(37)-C(2))-methylthiotransferase MtaB [Candidatus Dwaynia gallinarum]